jgi:translation initiation factor 1 (eIF-1/SUI1)
MNGRKRPIQLEWQGGLADTATESQAKRVPIKGEQPTAPQHPSTLQHPITGMVEVHRETKGRSGHPVLVLRKFSDGTARGEALKRLCTELKNRMACGGSVDDNSIVIQTTQVDRLLETLLKLDIKGKKCF